MFDEDGELVPKRFGKEGYEPRTTKVPCDLSIGCPKGHYSTNPDLNDNQRAVITLYRASIATGGRCLTDAERNDWFLTNVFAELQRADDDRRSRESHEATKKLYAILTRGKQ